MNDKKALINISNIHGGGALQVAISFVSELLAFKEVDSRIKLLVSDEVASGLSPVKLAESNWDIEVFNTYGIKTLWSGLNTIQKHYDVVFTLYGPKYTLFKAKLDIVGFAQLWILEFDNPVTRAMSSVARSKLKAKFGLQKWFFQRADHLVVELEHVKRSLSEQGVFDQDHITVVHNTLSNLYLDSSLWQALPLERLKDQIAIGFVTRDYSHKNIQILPKVAKILREEYRLPVKFYLSLTDAEWQNYSQDFGDYGQTVGALNVYQCPTFYQQMDAVIFPSLLECFSATPLEALVRKKPLFASERGFVRDVCQDYAMYFDPLDAKDIARVVADYFQGTQKTDAELEQARNHVLNFSNATQRAKDYLQIIQQHLEN
jgi:glycosyltransferase involved in cell wall biosynthesis